MFYAVFNKPLPAAVLKKTSALVIAVVQMFILTANAQRGCGTAPVHLISCVPFKTFSGGIITTKLLLNAFPDSLNFIVDTGSGDISLDSGTCNNHHVIPVLSDHTVVGIGGARYMRMLYRQHLRIGALADSVDMNVADYSLLSSVYGEKIDGILGNSFLSRYIVAINYDSMKIYFYSKGRIRYPKRGFLLKPTLSVLPIGFSSVRDKSEINSHFYFDTGAGLCLLLSNDFVSDSSLLEPKRKPFPAQAEGMGGKTEIGLTYVKEVKLGPYRFRNVPTYIFHDDYNITSYPSLGGLLGNDLLRRFNIILNYSCADIYLTPNSHFRDPFDYSYTGMSMYLENGRVRISDIMKNSPAEKAGLKPDDIIIAVNNDFTGNIQTYITLLQNVGRIKMIVQRGKAISAFTMKVKSIF